MAHAWQTSLILVVALGLATPGCGGKESSPSAEGEGGLGETGGASVTGATGGQSRSSGGSETGGAETSGGSGGVGVGGVELAGSPSGGLGQAGSSTGGRGQGGTSSGGVGGAAGGAGQSGSSSGGAVSGGASTGGAIQGGMGPGGDGHGGIVTGGEGGMPAGGQTGTGGTGGECDPPPCNWCDGTAVQDANGCTVGYVCANGADPCSTSPCNENTDCDPEDVCGDDGLCWPASSQCTVVSTSDGIVTCEEGYVYREEPLACTISVPRADYECGGGSCTTDADCAHLSYGHCSPNPLSMGVCTCFEGCQTDADCGANRLCQCIPALGVGRCMDAQCRGPSDCDPGRHCASYTGFACGVVEGFACQTDEDECASDSDCRPSGCQLGPDGHRICDSCGIS